MAKLNTNSNVYTIVYASVLVIIVAFLLAFVASALKPTQDANVALDKKKQILASLNLRDLADVEGIYAKVIKQDAPDGTMLAEVEGAQKLVVPMKGAGLWGGLWGYISVNKDGRTVYGAYFNHESETAGLGARIAEQWFQDEFQNKVIYDNEGNTILGVYKKGKAPAGLSEDSFVDAVTGATLTSNGVNDMIQKCFTENKPAIDAFCGGTSTCQPSKACCKESCDECCKEGCGECCKESCGECCKEGCGECCKDNCGECCKDDCGECCKSEKACSEAPCTNNK